MENAVYVVHDGRFAVFSISAFVAGFAGLILHQLSFSSPRDECQFSRMV